MCLITYDLCVLSRKYSRKVWTETVLMRCTIVATHHSSRRVHQIYGLFIIKLLCRFTLTYYCIIIELCVASSPSMATQSETAGVSRTGEGCGSGEVSGKQQRGSPKTSHGSYITKWTSESLEQITRDSRDRSGWRRLVRCAAQAADHHF